MLEIGNCCTSAENYTEFGNENKNTYCNTIFFCKIKKQNVTNIQNLICRRIYLAIYYFGEIMAPFYLLSTIVILFEFSQKVQIKAKCYSDHSGIQVLGPLCFCLLESLPAFCINSSTLSPVRAEILIKSSMRNSLKALLTISSVMSSSWGSAVSRSHLFTTSSLGTRLMWCRTSGSHLCL